ncbi:GNAT family N-acetyltransferase [Roseburia hominis]|nr:GNAT family N-acetyltransferase [Roseburia hominis]
MQFKDLVIQWMNEEFGNDKSYKFYKGIVEHSTKENDLPITFVMVENDELLGTVGIWRGDLLSRQDLYPWLSALIVNPKYRNRGIGKELQNYVLEYCRKKGYKEVFLYTDLKNYYEKNEWVQFDLGYEYSGSQVTIYKHQV